MDDNLKIVPLLRMKAAFKFWMSAPLHNECERRLTLSDGGHETRRLPSRRPAAVRCCGC
jgi:hypothetical protein